MIIRGGARVHIDAHNTCLSFTQTQPMMMVMMMMLMVDDDDDDGG